MALALAAGAVQPAVAQGRCLPPDSVTLRRVAWLEQLLTSPDSQFAASRRSFGIERVPFPEVNLVRPPELVVPLFADTLCAHALHLVDSLWALPPRSAGVLVYRLGPGHFGVEDPSFPIAFTDWDRVVWIFTSGWYYLGGVGIHRPPPKDP